MDNCFEIGIIQTFVDGELSSSRAEDVVRHLSTCNACAEVAADLELDNEMMFEALGTELDYMVPTERLRERVFSTIAEREREPVGMFGGLTAALAGFATMLNGRTAAAFGSVLLGLGLVGGSFWFVGQGLDSELAAVDPLQVENTEAAAIPNDTYSAREVDAQVVTEAPVRAYEASAPAPKKRSKRIVKRNEFKVRPAVATDAALANAIVNNAPPIEAEDGYLRTIATLNRTVNQNKDFVLRPSERVEFERNLAVVDDAIKKMRGEVKKNPKNNGAKEVLRSSYKSKIELLNSVAERAETVAALD